MIGYKSEVHTSSSSVLINLLERPEETHTYTYQFILKGIKIIQMISQMKRYIGQGGKRHSFHALSEHVTLPGIFTSSPTQKFSEPGPFGFLWSLHYTGMMD